MSSTSKSVEDRLSPSFVSYSRVEIFPTTTTRVPFVMLAATCSARSRQALQRMNSLRPSFHSFVCRSKTFSVDATVNEATATPAVVNLSSGSAVVLPITVMVAVMLWSSSC